MSDRRNVVRVIALAAILVAAVRSGQYLNVSGWDIVALDFEVFWRAAGEPLAEVYQPHEMPFAYPPTALLLFFPLRFFDLQTGFVAWSLISIGVFTYGVTKLCGPLIATFSLFSTAGVLGLVLGQVPMLLAGLTFLALTLPPFACGLVIAFVTVIKPQLMLFAPIVFLIRKEWIVLAGIGIGGLAFVILSVWLFGYALWGDWLAAMFSLASKSVPLITPTGQAAYRGIPQMPVWIASVVISTAAVVAYSNKIEGAKLIGLIVTASVVASPYARVQDTIAVVPASIAMLGNPVMTLPAFLIITGPHLLTMLAMVTALALCVCAGIISRKKSLDGDEAAP